MPRSWRLIAFVTMTGFAATSLAGCATMPSSSAQGAIKAFYCGTDVQAGAYVPVRWSKSDTDETIAQTKANNAVHKEICR